MLKNLLTYRKRKVVKIEMDRLFINVPVGDDILEDKQAKYVWYFQNLQEIANQKDEGSKEDYKNVLLCLLLRRNKLVYKVDEIVEIAVNLAETFLNDYDVEWNIEELLAELIDEDYFVELGKK